MEYRGVVEDAPGLYFCGLSFQFAFSSMVFMGVGRDADFVAGPHRRAFPDARPPWLPEESTVTGLAQPYPPKRR